MPRSFNAWLDYLNTLHSSVIDLGLERIQPLAEKMHLTQFPCSVITVAGTNGKGSCIRFLELAYLAAGFQVAAYTSPHLLHFNERLRINDEVLTETAWVKAFAQVESLRADVPLTFFEFTTLAALWLCQQQPLDVLILEVGLGGRLDAVNVVQSDLSVITSIDFDHQEYLGETREAIAKEKAGIFKERTLAVCGDTDIPLIVFELAEQKNVSLYCLNHDYFYEVYEKSWVWFSGEQRYNHLALPKLNLQDAATSLMVLELLQNKLPITHKAIQQSVAEASLMGRFEKIATPVATIYLDVAHNPHAVQYLTEKLQAAPLALGGRTVAVFGMLRDKDVKSCIALMEPFIDEWFVADLPTERACSAHELAELMAGQGKNCYTFATVAEALRTALESCQFPDRVIVFGSFYTVAGALECLQQIDPNDEQTIERGISVTPQMRHRIVGLLVLLGLVALFLPLLFSNEEPIDNIANLSQQVPKAPPMPVVKMELNKPEISEQAETLAATAASTAELNTSPAAAGMAQLTPAPESTGMVSEKPRAEASSSTPVSVPAELSASTGTTAAEPVATSAEPISTPASAVKPSKPLSATSSSAASSAVVAKPAARAASSSLPVVAVPAKKVAPTGLAHAPAAWTIQVASYANNKAAQLLVQRLRAEGFSAYTREATINGNKRMTRVFVGPEINQAKVKQTQAQLKRRFKLAGVIVKYSVN